MIQRIQTIYLLIVSVLAAVMLFMPLARFANDAGPLGLYAFGIKSADGQVFQSTIYLGMLLTAAAILPFITVFLFKRRRLQIRLCVVEIVLLLAVVAMLGACYFMDCRIFPALNSGLHKFELSIALPIVCLLFAGLAVRAISSDERLVRAADRIR